MLHQLPGHRLPLNGGIRLLLAIGAVVLELPGCHRPDSGQVSPVREVVPKGLRAVVVYIAQGLLRPSVERAWRPSTEARHDG